MNRRMILLNLSLLALTGALVWILRANWIEAQARERAVLLRKVEPKAVLAPPALPRLKTAAPADYIDVASKMLFAADRNPTVIVVAEPPRPAPPQPVMPALPDYHGQITIGEPVILLSPANGGQRSYQPGDQVGEFKLVGFDQEKAVFEWKGKSIERNLEDLRPKPGLAQAAPTAAPAPVSAPPKSVASLDHPDAPSAAPVNSAASPASAKAVTSLSSPAAAKTSNANGNDTAGDEFFGPVLAGGFRACVASDNSPAGTVHSGYRKVQVMSMVGALCSWEQVK